MKPIATHAFTAVSAFALAMLIGYSVQPAEAAPITAPGCLTQSASTAPTISTPLAREHLLAV